MLYDAVASVEVPVVLTISPSTWALGGRRMKVTYLLCRYTLSWLRKVAQGIFSKGP
ncbi:hypothetical protein D3C80_2233780 [compost metagenome]